MVALTILSYLTVGKDSLIWDSSRLKSSGLPESTRTSLTCLRVFPDIRDESHLDSFRIGISMILKDGSREAEINRVSASPRSFASLDLLTSLTGGKPWDFSLKSSLRLRLSDLGFGGLEGLDRLAAYGTVEAEVESLEGFTSDSRSEIVSAVGKPIAVENPKRVSLTITNEGPGFCWLSLRAFAQAREGLFLTPGGGSFSINKVNPWFGPVAAICLPGTTARLSVSEVSFQ